MGVGGPELDGEGLRSIFPMSDLSVMGMADVLARLPLLFWRLRQTVRAILAERPDLVLLINSQVFSQAIARRLREAGYGGKILLYVAPSVWAWKPERAAVLRPLLDEILAVLPFEPRIDEGARWSEDYLCRPSRAGAELVSRRAAGTRSGLAASGQPDGRVAAAPAAHARGCRGPAQSPCGGRFRSADREGPARARVSRCRGLVAAGSGHGERRGKANGVLLRRRGGRGQRHHHPRARARRCANDHNLCGRSRAAARRRKIPGSVRGLAEYPARDGNRAGNHRPSSAAAAMSLLRSVLCSTIPTSGGSSAKASPVSAR